MLHPGDPELGNINAVPVLLLVDEVSSDMSSINGGAEVVVVVVLVTKVTGTGKKKIGFENFMEQIIL